jgi:limonene-1,2-epoxide hydrolase
MDPDGKGQIGKQAIAKFCAAFIRPDGIRFEVRQTLTSGGACVNVGTIYAKGQDGTVSWNEVVNIYEVNEAGKITLLRSYWDFEAAAKSAF